MYKKKPHRNGATLERNLRPWLCVYLRPGMPAALVVYIRLRPGILAALAGPGCWPSSALKNPLRSKGRPWSGPAASWGSDYIFFLNPYHWIP